MGAKVHDGLLLAEVVSSSHMRFRIVQEQATTTRLDTPPREMAGLAVLPPGRRRFLVH